MEKRGDLGRGGERGRRERPTLSTVVTMAGGATTLQKLEDMILLERNLEEKVLAIIKVHQPTQKIKIRS